MVEQYKTLVDELQAENVRLRAPKPWSPSQLRDFADRVGALDDEQSQSIMEYIKDNAPHAVSHDGSLTLQLVDAVTLIKARDMIPKSKQMTKTQRRALADKCRALSPEARTGIMELLQVEHKESVVRTPRGPDFSFFADTPLKTLKKIEDLL